MKPGDVVVGVLVGAQETNARPGPVITGAVYLAGLERLLGAIEANRTRLSFRQQFTVRG